MKSGIFNKMKKALIVVMIFITMGFMMPVKSKADLINDFVDLILHIPDGIMHVIDQNIGGSEEFTFEELDLNNADDGGRGEIYNFIVTPYEIFTSGVYEDNGTSYETNIGWLDINFFSDKKITSNSTQVSSEILAPVVGNMYKALRNLAMVLMLLVILYIGIKILISSIAAQQAKYKQFLVDWVVGFCLLFVMHYIMSGIVNLNSLVSKILSNDEGDSYYLGVSELKGELDTSSRWLDVVKSVDGSSGIMKGDKYTNFKKNRISVEGGDSSTSKYDVKDNGADTGELDMNGYSNICFSGNSVDLSKWGKNGKIYLSATIYNNNSEQHMNKAILKLNAMSYVRTISSFSAGSEWFSGNRKVQFYKNASLVEAEFATSMGYAAVYLCLVIETIMFLFTYIKRVLQMSFLTMIAPIVAIMYPVDKLGDGKAQAFNTWFKDYLFNVLIQPMHLLLYTVFIVAAGQLISTNIIYGVAVYGFMIPAEKYFKKILGFEKASTGGGGPLGGAIGRGLAMDGLGRLAGIGPAGRKYSGGDGKGGSGKASKKMKLRKNKPAGAGSPLAPGADGGIGGGIGGGTGSSTAAGGRRGRTSPGTGGGTSGTGSSTASRRNSPSTGGRTPNSLGSRLRAFRGEKGFIPALGRTIDKKMIRGATGGKYSKASWEAAGAMVANAGKFVGKKVSEYGVRGAGAAMMGAVGLVAGTATAMATGDINNVWKGATVGIGAGNKMGQNMYDRGAGFLSDFSNDIKADRAAVDDDYNAKLRLQEAKDDYREQFDEMSDSDPEKAGLEAARDEYAQYVDLKGDMNSLKALAEINKFAGNDPDLRDIATKVELFYDAKSWGDLKESKRADDYRKYYIQEAEEANGGPLDPTALTALNAKIDKRIKAVRKAQSKL